MQSATVSVLKKELKHHSQEELVELCLKLARFKKENKELLTYVLFESDDESEYIRKIKEEVDEGFSALNQKNLYYVKKGLRKILRALKKYIRYSKNKESEADILLYFCEKICGINSRHQQSRQIINMYERQLLMAKKAISTLHEDLQYDYNRKVEDIENFHF